MNKIQLPKNLPKGQWSESAKKVLAERYLLKDETGKVLETPEEMCYRVALALAGVEEKWGVKGKELEKLTKDFYEMMVRQEFLPNSPTLANAGRKNKLQLSACYVLPVEDSLIGIFDAIKNAAIIHQSGGGTGFSFSRLRPHASFVASSGGQASGPVGFMRIFDAATQEVKQGGIRRGANMGILRVDHPDILQFIECKLGGGITNFNISVGVTDKFMQALEKDTEYELINPHTKKVVNHFKARDVFEKIYQAAWQSGDPGMIWLDRINKSRANPVPELGPIEATNPCGEQPLYPNEACNLGSLNVSLFVKDGKVDWTKMKEVVHLSIRLLDNVIEDNPYPLAEIDQACKANRRVGLGLMGWADLLFQLEIPYESNEALELAEKLMKFITEEGHKASQDLAKVRGPFPNFQKSIYNTGGVFSASKNKASNKDGPKMRNSTVTTIAPTGTISIIANCSSGIEPIFALSFSHIVGERHLKFVNPYFLAAAHKAKLAEEILKKIEDDGRINGLDVPEKLKKVFKIAHEIEPVWHVKMQAAFQKYTDNAVSKTINLPHDALAEDVRDAYLLAYKLGCMGITVFRDGSKSEQVLHVGKEKPASAKSYGETKDVIKKTRPEVVAGATYRMETPLGTAFITINQNEGEPLETFINIGKAGSDVAAEAEALGRMISLLLRIASPLPVRERAQEIVNQLQGIGGAHSLGFGEKRVRSLPDAIAKALALHFDLKSKNGHGLNGSVKLISGNMDEAAYPADSAGSASQGKIKFDLCPKCGEAAVAYEEGCRKCHSCGYSEC